jgi:hypothetical protein
MSKPNHGWKLILAREIDGRREVIEWIRRGDTVWIVNDDQETVIGPDAWLQAWADLQTRGFVEIFPTDQREMRTERDRVSELIRRAFRGVTLGDGIGLHEAQGLDDYADDMTLASYRAQDEKHDWAAIPAAELDACYSSLSFFDADGMRFHLPAYLIADLEESLMTADIVYHLTSVVGDPASRFNSLSSVQREAVREFLLLQRSDAHRRFQHEMIDEALRAYWTPRS